MISRGAEETCHRVDIRSSVLVRLLPRGRRDYRIRPKSWPSNGLDSSRDFLVFLFLVEPDTLVSRLGAATFFAVGLIGASIIVKMSLYIQLPALYWDSFTWLSLHIVPLLLLGLAIGFMATPSAAYWRRQEHELIQKMFE